MKTGVPVEGMLFGEEEMGHAPAAPVAAGAGGVGHGPEPYADLASLFARLAQSDFRRRFHLREADRRYVADKGWDVIRRHAADFVRSRLSPACPARDGKQTPMRGHPVFIAQHATGCCCRGCLAKWHHIPQGRPLTAGEQRYVVHVLMGWISREILKNE